MSKLQSPQYAKENIISNYKANYDMEHSSANEGDVERFITNALDQFEKIVRADCAYDRDKQDEAVKNLHRDYLKNLIFQRQDELNSKVGDSEMLDSEAGFLAGLDWVKAKL